MGFKILIVWESDYRKNKTEILSMCNDFINK
jgi:G:T-mismatch repair DNA endonuclease (very short patch repair protein)